MSIPKVAILHYTAPPVVAGVEAVIEAHTQLLLDNGCSVSVIAGRGEASALPSGVDVVVFSELDSQHEEVAEISARLEMGEVPPGFEEMVNFLADRLGPVLDGFHNVIVHNVFTKHFNLPLTAALWQLLDEGAVRGCIAWCHDFTWTSPSSRRNVHAGYPWDLLRTYRGDVVYVTVSSRRQRVLAELLSCPEERIRVVFNGVDPERLLGLCPQGESLIARLGLLESDLVMLMPVRVARVKNIEFGIRVVAELKEQGRSPKLVVTGPPDAHDVESMAYLEELRGLRRECGVEEEVHFVYEASASGRPLTIGSRVVGDLYRVSDLMLMPSRREGFGMPVLEAALVGIPVFCTDVPAADEIGRADVVLFDTAEPPAKVAGRILEWVEESRVHRLRRRVRQQFTWQAMFRDDILPLLHCRTGEDC
jgi:glycosyltransferase involved in cell wall biosynthesis